MLFFHIFRTSYFRFDFSVTGDHTASASRVGFPPSLHIQRGLYTAGIYDEAVWRIQDSNLSFRTFIALICVHKNIGKLLTRSFRLHTFNFSCSIPTSGP
ncbi:hypothetical protein FGIG_12632 [Fasciola gigantica]|uniref:Uncharacterized protein n=1 Tax=Fasciola gigantica TaxID=46835 RepID=A0A504YNU9_FASGI|nr:hypothetical protein FGIG_12632 [Fasciola gigantica]